MTKRVLLLLFAGLFTSAGSTLADDWPQWRGPNRDNRSQETGLLQEWPEGGPKLLWTFTKAGNGYSAFAIVGDRLYTMGADDKNEFVLAVDVKTAKEAWRTSYGPKYDNNRGGGPRCTPTVDGEVLYALGGQGELVCLKTSDGTKVWSVNLKRDLKGSQMGGWGYSESVLVDGDKVICTPGGRDGTLAALNKTTGKVLWRTTDLTDQAGYSSVCITEIGGVKQYVQQTRNGVVGVRAEDGKLLWRHENDSYRTAVVPTPILKDNYVYVTAGYGVGSTLLKLAPDGSGGTKIEKVIYDKNKDMINKHGGVVLVDGHVYGYQDNRRWASQDLMTGKTTWAEQGSLGRAGSASITYADGRLYLLSDGGAVGLLNATPKEWDLKGKFELPQESRIRARRGAVWSHPVIAEGRLYLRDQDLIFCYDVKK